MGYGDNLYGDPLPPGRVAGMQPYATPADLARWLGLPEPEGDDLPAGLPADVERRLLRASELVEGYVLAGYATHRLTGAPSDPDTATWLADAACAQVEFWGIVSEEHGIAGVTTGTMSAGGVSHDMPGLVAPRALNVLDRAGLRVVGGYGSRPYRRPFDIIAGRQQR